MNWFTPDAALPPTRHCGWRVFFGTSPDFWMNLQKSYDLAAAEESLESELPRIHCLSGERAA